MGEKKSGALKKGAVITHKDKNKEGVVIDWGIVINMKRGFNGEYRELMLPNTELADSIRVRTSEGTIEIWPTEEVEFTGVY